MQHIPTMVMAGILSASFAVPAVPAVAQQLLQPVTPPATPTRTGPQLQQAQATPAPQVSSDPGQRPQSSSPIPSTGPAQGVSPEAGKALGDTAGKRSGQPAKVLDAKGSAVNGLIQVAPNRVFDPATGRYHWTVPSGQEQKIIE